MDAPPASAIRRAARLCLWLALALTALTTYLIVGDPGAKFVILVVLFVPPMFAAYYVAALPPAWLAFKIIELSRWAVVTGLAIAAIAAAGLIVPFSIFNFLVPHYFTPGYRATGIELAPDSDFVTPWGARMIALRIPAHELAKRPASTLWVAENEFTRGEYARLMGTGAESDARLPMTSLSREQVEALLEAMNGAGARGRYRLPTYEEVRLFSGDWWINRYPKLFFFCQSKLEAVGEQPPNGLGLRGTVDNAAELVFQEKRYYCATVGGLEPHCGRRWTEEGSIYKSVGLTACDDRNADKVWKRPGVGLRVVFARD